jgi:hypothetical protein
MKLHSLLDCCHFDANLVLRQAALLPQPLTIAPNHELSKFIGRRPG